MNPAAAYTFGKLEVYGMLAGEPFNLPLDRIARLTDWQIQMVYCLPAQRRAALVTNKTPPPWPWEEVAEAKPEDFAGLEDVFVKNAMTAIGGTADYWRATFRAQKARADAAKGTG